MMAVEKSEHFGRHENSKIGTDYNSFLNEAGKRIYNLILGHCKAMGIDNSIDIFELTMLANSFALYAEAAEFCNENGVSMTFKKPDNKGMKQETQPKEGGQYQQVRPEYTVMKNEYQNILKHSAKFGLNPGDRSKIFGVVKEKPKKDPSKGLD